jgi:peptide-methionine (S)-S-oxide reductase
MSLRNLTTKAFNNSNKIMAPISHKLALGAGCYWGTEKFVVKDFQKRFPDSIKDAKVGFMAPDPKAMENPSYRQVCSGSTGHVEVLYVELKEPVESNFEHLMRFFYQFHDPTTKDRQGNDAGSQYASAVFCDDDKQKEIALKVKGELQELVNKGKVKYSKSEVVTNIVGMNPFYPAEAEHQEYLDKNPSGYCNHRIVFKEWPELN